MFFSSEGEEDREREIIYIYINIYIYMNERQSGVSGISSEGGIKREDREMDTDEYGTVSGRESERARERD